MYCFHLLGFKGMIRPATEIEIRAATHRLCQLDEAEYQSFGKTNEQIRDGILLAWAWDRLLAWNQRQGDSPLFQNTEKSVLSSNLPLCLNQQKEASPPG